MGGSVAAIEQGYMQEEIARSSYQYQRKIESGEKIIVGLNKFLADEKPPENVFRVDESIRTHQSEKLKLLRARRDNAKVNSILAALETKAKGEENLMPIVIEAVENYATLGEIADVLRNVFGEYKG